VTRTQRLILTLGSVALLLSAVLIAQKFGLGDDYRLAPLGPGEGKAPPPTAPVRRAMVLEPFSNYEMLLQRPLFNEDRKPTPIEEEVSATPQATVAALDAQLTGIILMPNTKLAMLRENASGKGLRVRLGSELDGALAGWKLVDLQPRKAVFEAQGQGRQELELAVDKAGAPAVAAPALPNMQAGTNPMGRPQPTPSPAEQATPGMQQAPNKEQMVQSSGDSAQPVEPAQGSTVEPEQPEVAESIRQRIEERRRQLREEAARLMQQQPQK